MKTLWYKLLSLLFPNNIWTAYKFNRFINETKNWKESIELYMYKNNWDESADWRLSKVQGKRDQAIKLGEVYVNKFPIDTNNLNYIHKIL